MKKTYTQSAEEVLQDLDAGPEGLSTAQAQQRLAKFGPNKLKEGEKPTLLQRFVAQLKDPMLIILLIAAGVSALTGMLAGENEWAEVIIILAVVLLNAILGVVQESKAEAAIEALQTMTAATCKVVRDGRMMILHSDTLVPGDLILLEAVLLPLAHVWGFWKGGTDILIYASFILLAKVLWHLIDYGLNAKTAAQINERIRKNRLKKNG